MIFGQPVNNFRAVVADGLSPRRHCAAEKEDRPDQGSDEKGIRMIFSYDGQIFATMDTAPPASAPSAATAT